MHSKESEGTNPEQIRADIEATRAGLSRNVDALAQTIRPGNVAARQKDRVTAAVFGVTDKATSAVFGAKDAVVDTLDQVQPSTGEAKSAAPHLVRQGAQGNPLAAGLIAVGVGWLAGSLLPATRVERQAADTLKEKTAPLMQEVTDMAKQSAQNLQEPAKEALSQVKDAGEEAVQTVKEEGSSTLSDVTDTVKEGAANVQEASASS